MRSLNGISRSQERYQCNGLFTLHGNGTSAGNRTGTIGNNGCWFLSLSQASVNISTWYFLFGTCNSPGPSVNIPKYGKFNCFQTNKAQLSILRSANILMKRSADLILLKIFVQNTSK